MKVIEDLPQRPNDICPLLVGEAIPVVAIPDTSGRLYQLNIQAAKQPSVLMFYRGGWCPYCNRALAGMQVILSELTEMGYQLIAISTDSPQKLSQSVSEHHLSYTLLSDADLKVSKQFGIAYKAPGDYEEDLIDASEGKNVDKLIPLPSVFILSKDGIIRFGYTSADFMQRISPALLKAAACALIEELI